MKWDERVIATAISRQVLQQKCLLLVDNCSWTGAECDVLAVTRDLRIIDIEIKVTRADLKADAGKDKWWHYQGFGRIENGKHIPAPRTARKWPHRIWKHYYAMPADIWKDELLDALASPASGVILLREGEPMNAHVIAEVVRRARPNRDAKTIDQAAVLDIARLANLRMWDAYEQISRMAMEINDERREAVS